MADDYVVTEDSEGFKVVHPMSGAEASHHTLLRAFNDCKRRARVILCQQA